MFILESRVVSLFLSNEHQNGASQASSIYIRTVTSYLLFSFDKFNSFLTGLVRNQVCGACCSCGDSAFSQIPEIIW